MKIRNHQNLLFFICLIVLALISFFFFFRIDLTSDKRYSIADQTKMLMAKTDSPLKVVVYLDGDLNPGFLRLKKSTAELLDELSVYSNHNIDIQFENPSLADSPEQREKKYTELQNKGLAPTAVYERDKEGKSIQKVIFPWIEMTYKEKKSTGVPAQEYLREFWGREPEYLC